MASVITDSVTESTSTRITREGRKITYRLRVIQQPERARACGSGAKSSADRRPVDPPPIVELKLFEGEPDHEGNYHNDITWPFRANFFLFATLENARTIAHGRLPNPASFPVLTGTPVAGMSYLDRPEPAGYFIFPDLSVRHEGNYKLSFALYEELKEAKDMDPAGTPSIQVQASGIDAHVTHRLEVQSKQFQVYSAKKFPGLKESTNLSRTVAEQGCRVRIRRDVRMRRRDTKGGDKWDDYEDDTAHERARHTSTPDNYTTPQPNVEASRPGSASNASNASFAPPQRRPSMQDMSQNYQQGYSQSMAPPQPPQNGYPAPPQYNNAPSSYQNQYSQQSHGQSMMQPPPAPFQTSPQSYQSSAPPQPAPSQHNMPQMPQSYGYMQSHNYPQQNYEQPQQQQQHHHVRHESMEYSHSSNEYRRPALHQSPNHSYHSSNNMMPPYNAVDRQPQMNQGSMQQIPPLQSHLPSSSAPLMNGRSLAPLKTEKLEPASPSYQVNSSVSTSPHEMHFATQNKFAAAQAGSKRSYSSTFDTKHLDQPLRQGARPSIATEEYHGGYDDGAGDMEVPDRCAMSYRRADGTSRSRRVPVAHD